MLKHGYIIDTRTVGRDNRCRNNPISGGIGIYDRRRQMAPKASLWVSPGGIRSAGVRPTPSPINFLQRSIATHHHPHTGVDQALEPHTIVRVANLGMQRFPRFCGLRHGLTRLAQCAPWLLAGSSARAPTTPVNAQWRTRMGNAARPDLRPASPTGSALTWRSGTSSRCVFAGPRCARHWGLSPERQVKRLPSEKLDHEDKPHLPAHPPTHLTTYPPARPRAHPPT